MSNNWKEISARIDYCQHHNKELKEILESISIDDTTNIDIAEQGIIQNNIDSILRTNYCVELGLKGLVQQIEYRVNKENRNN